MISFSSTFSLLLSMLSLINSIDITCTLTGVADLNPYPSLAKCYKYNSDACCTSVHDDYINSYLSSLLTPSCMRKYSELEDLMCFGCHPFESLYSDRRSKVIHICPQYAMQFWNVTSVDQLAKPTKRFDNCGFKVPPNLKDEVSGKNYIIPSEFFGSFVQFIEKIQIPFFEDYKVVLDEVNSDYCFGNSQRMKCGWTLVSFGLIVIGLLS